MHVDRLVVHIHDGGDAELEGLVQCDLLALVGVDVGVSRWWAGGHGGDEAAFDDDVAGLDGVGASERCARRRG